jgi:hypothetical protein
MKRTAIFLAILASLIIAAISWRLHRTGAEARQSSPAHFGATDHAATNLISAHAIDPLVATPSEQDILTAATNQALRVQCIKNLKQIGLAARVWARKNKTDAMPGDKEALKQYLGDPENVEKVLRCPADEKAGYEFLSLGVSENNSQIVFASCSIHNNVGLIDGSAHQLDAEHKVIQRDGKWIIGL